MAFKIRRGEPLARAVRRLARGQIRAALEVLGQEQLPLSERVHEVRVAIKKGRALTQLFRATAGRRARKADRTLRAIGRRLAGARDAEVLIDTFESLVEPHNAARSPTLRRTRGRLLTLLRKSAHPFNSRKALKKVRSKLERAHWRLRRWIPAKGGWRVVGPGLVDGYRRARRSMIAAYQQPSGRAFHDWRKAVKRHRYQSHVLEQVWPDETRARLADLERLGEMLGEEHDLGLLKATIESERTSFADDEEYLRLLALVDNRRRQLRADARPLGERLFADRPRALTLRLRAAVRRARQAPPTAAPAPAPASAPKAA